MGGEQHRWSIQACFLYCFDVSLSSHFAYGKLLNDLPHSLSITFGGIGGIMAGLVFRNQDAPTYIPGIICNIVMQAFMFVVVAVTAWDLNRKNKAVKAGATPPLEGKEGFLFIL